MTLNWSKLQLHKSYFHIWLTRKVCLHIHQMTNHFSWMFAGTLDARMLQFEWLYSFLWISLDFGWKMSAQKARLSCFTYSALSIGLTCFYSVSLPNSGSFPGSSKAIISMHFSCSLLITQLGGTCWLQTWKKKAWTYTQKYAHHREKKRVKWLKITSEQRGTTQR